MADRDILDAVLRLEATNREDHQCIQTQIRGYASRTIKLEAAVGALAETVRERQEACVRRHSRINHINWAIIAGVGAAALAVVARFLLTGSS